MKKLLFTTFCLLSVSLLIITSCDDDNESETLVSKIGMLKSHNAGEDCTTCHKSGGTGEGIFQIAGTVFDSNGIGINPNGVIKLYTGLNGSGTLVKSVEVDGKGNFYSTESIDFSGNNIRPGVTGFSGRTVYMQSIATSGKCNSCHNGTTTSKLWVY